MGITKKEGRNRAEERGKGREEVYRLTLACLDVY